MNKPVEEFIGEYEALFHLALDILDPQDLGKLIAVLKADVDRYGYLAPSNSEGPDDAS